MDQKLMRSTGLVAAGAVAATLAWQAFGAADAANTDTYKQLNLFGDVFDRVRADYVEAPEDELLIENAINGMLAGLDPHSSYMNAKRFQEMQVQTRGEFGGLGIEVTMENGVVKVISPIDDTPASKAGVLAGDLIVEIDGQQVQGLTLEQAVDKMRGKVNTPINLTLVRQGREEPFEIKLVRDLIRLKAVKYELEGNDVGYIRISTFSEQTQEGLDAALSAIKTKAGANLKGYVIDLRNNAGGLLDQAVSVTDTFLERGEIVSTRGRNAAESSAPPGRGRRSAERQTAGRADQRRLGFGFGDRRRCAPGPQAGDRHRHPVVRQGFRADHHSPGRPGRHAPDDRPVLHAFRPLDSGQGHRSHLSHRRRRARRQERLDRPFDRRRGEPQGAPPERNRWRGRWRLVGLCSP